MTDSTSMSDPPYERWQRLLAARFWADPVGPVVMLIDDDELRLIAPGIDDPAADLASAVMGSLEGASGMRWFSGVLRDEAMWRLGDRAGPPPTLPVLALSVLAATRMHTDSAGASHNYYLRLAQALLPGGSPAQVEAARVALGVRGRFEDVADMWAVFDRWVIERWGVGISTIRDDPRLRRIGYPLSQGLLRKSDRAVLTRFFAALDITHLGVPSGDDAVLKFLRLWVSRPRGFSDTFLQATQSPELSALLSPLLTALAASWDGQIRTPEGIPQVDVRLALDLDDWKAWWEVATAPGIDRDVLIATAGGGAERSLAIERDADRPLYRTSGTIPVTGAAAAEGIRLSGTNCVAGFPPREVWALALDPDAGAWLSTRSITPFEEHVLAVRAPRAAEIWSVLEACAEPGFTAVKQSGPKGPLLAGWKLIQGVVLSSADALDLAVSSAPALGKAAIRPDLTARPRMVNGLPLAREIGARLYLSGGEPDLLLPVGTERREVHASLDGVSQVPPFSATGFPIPLRRVGLAVGDHVLVADGQTQRFTTLVSSPRSGSIPGTGSIGWDQSGHLNHTGGAAFTVGAQMDGETGPEPLLARRGRDECWLLLRNGHCQPVEEPGVPDFLAAHLPAARPQYFEYWPVPGSAWLAQRRGARWEITPLSPVAPGFRQLDGQSRRIWEQVCAFGPKDSLLWRSYARSAAGVHGR